MDTLFESARMMASFKDRTIEPGCFLRESIGVNNSIFAIELSESFLSKDASASDDEISESIFF